MHIVAVRGSRALSAKAGGELFTECVGPECDTEPDHFDNLKESDHLVAFMNAGLSCFPVRLRIALSHASHVRRSHTYLRACVFAILTRDGDAANRSCWEKQITPIYHLSRALKNAPNGLGDAVQNLVRIVQLKIIKQTDEHECGLSNIAELIVQLFLASVEECPGDDSACFAAPLCELIWLCEAIVSAVTRTISGLFRVMDDQFTGRVSPYRGLALSKPLRSALNESISESFTRFTGIKVSCPPGTGSDGKIQTASFENFLEEMCLLINVVEVFKLASRQIFDIIHKFNLRYHKASTTRETANSTPITSFNKMLTEPWSDDVELRSITRAYKTIIRHAKSRFDLASLLGTVLSGAFSGLTATMNVEGISGRVSQLERKLSFSNILEFNLDWWRRLADSYEAPPVVFQDILANQSVYRIETSVKQLQSWWRGIRIRKIHHQSLREMAYFIQNTGWPDIGSADFLNPPEVVANSTLTRASLMRLVPVGKPQPVARTSTESRRPATPTGSVSSHLSIKNTTVVQADHIACGKLVFILTYNLYMRRLMVEYFLACISALEHVTRIFTELICRNPQYEIALNQSAENLRKRVLTVSKTNKTHPRSAAPVSDTIKQKLEVPKVLKPTYVPHATRILKADKPLVVELDVAPVEPPVASKMNEKYLADYVRFFEGDDSLLRDISSACAESLVFPHEESDSFDWVWLSTKPTRFAKSRTRLLSVISSETGKGVFIKAEASGDFLKCFAVLSDSQIGSLNICGSPSPAVPFWMEHVCHLAVGYIAQCARQQSHVSGLNLLTRVIDSMSSSLKRLHPDHRMALEAIVLDAAMGFAYFFPMECSERLQSWIVECVKRLKQLGHTVRLSKTLLRYACVQAKRSCFTSAMEWTEKALEPMMKESASLLFLCGKFNRAVFKYHAGQREAAEVEMRELTRCCSSHTGFDRIKKLAARCKEHLTTNRVHKAGDR